MSGHASSRANYFKLGLFVTTGTVIAIVATIVLGVGAVLRPKILIETYFEESVQGLSEGSPVKYRGVKIGSVEKIGYCRQLYEQTATNQEHLGYVYVLFSIDPDLDYIRESLLGPDIDRGLRVQLASVGLTGQVYLEADFLDPELNPVLEFSWKPIHDYLPSATSTLEAFSENLTSILRNLERVEWGELAGSLNQLLKTLDARAQELDVPGLQTEFGSAASELRTLIAETREIVGSESIDKLPEELREFVASLRKTTDSLEPEVRSTLERLGNASDAIGEVAGSVDQFTKRGDVDDLLERLPRSVAQLERVLTRLNQVVSAQQQDVEMVVENLRVFTQDLREITSLIKRNPSQLLFGNPPEPKEPGQ